MIELLGSSGTSEYRAAEAIRDALAALWPDVANSPQEVDHIKIMSSAKIAGYGVQDIDIILCGALAKPRWFKPKRALHTQDGKRIVGTPVDVSSFAVAIEVKDHSETGVKVSGDQVEVQYRRGGPPKWSSATDQNNNQVYTLRDYLADLGAKVFVRRCLIMQGLDRISAPSAIAAGFDGNALFSAICAASKLHMGTKRAILSAGDAESVFKMLKAPVFTPVQPTRLDRRRMDLIATKSKTVDEVLEQVGTKLTILRGHGGTGKTVVLLQAARKSFQTDRKRTLFLTYNQALAADVRRLLCLLGIPTNPDDGGIVVDTVMSFVYSWLSALKLLDEEDFDLERYPALLEEVTEMMAQDAITPEDIEVARQAKPYKFDFDQVFIDEAQDWPATERDLVSHLYGFKNLVVADGIDQLVRGARIEWDDAVPGDDVNRVALPSSLRMKRNLSIITAELARSQQIGWTAEANKSAGGGRILVLKTPYRDNQNLHDELLERTKEAGNEAIDFLMCVPPGDILKSNEGVKTSGLSNALRGWDHEVWDGVDQTVRKSFPRDIHDHRVVQYQSCRGLEGWVVVLSGFDEYLAFKEQERRALGLSDADRADFLEIDTVSTRYAWRHGLIAFTRPIDTLVIELSDPTCAYSQVILGLAKQHEDIFEII
jgi:hypothetical protein